MKTANFVDHDGVGEAGVDGAQPGRVPKEPKMKIEIPEGYIEVAAGD